MRTEYELKRAFDMADIYLSEGDIESISGIPKEQILEILQENSTNREGNGTRLNAIIEDWKSTRTISALNFERVQSRLFKIQPRGR